MKKIHKVAVHVVKNTQGEILGSFLKYNHALDYCIELNKKGEEHTVVTVYKEIEMNS